MKYENVETLIMQMLNRLKTIIAWNKIKKQDRSSLPSSGEMWGRCLMIEVWVGVYIFHHFFVSFWKKIYFFERCFSADPFFSFNNTFFCKMYAQPLLIYSFPNPLNTFLSSVLLFKFFLLNKQALQKNQDTVCFIYS